VWADFFVAAAGASAALAGLVFVALSVNKSQLIRASHLPPGAAAAIGTLILILFSSVAALIHQPPPALGIEIIAFGLYACWLELSSARQGIAARAKFQRPQWGSVLNAVRGQIQVLPFIVGGILLLTNHDGGPYWVAGGCIAVFIVSVLNASVLLIEIPL
jgi:hypothetical protein